MPPAHSRLVRAHLCSESLETPQLFLYEPSIIRSVASLAELAQNPAPVSVRSSAFYALDGFLRVRKKATDVFNAVSVATNHGLLLQNVRDVIERVSALPHDPIPAPQDVVPPSEESGGLGHLVDSVLTLLAAATNSSTGPAAIIAGAGLVPLLVHIVDKCNWKRYLVPVSRAIGIIDSLVYAQPTVFSLFTEAIGAEAYVRRIEREIDEDIAHPQSAESILDTVGDEPGSDARDNLYGRLTFGGASLLRNLFKSIAHMMSSAGTADGLRNLIDTSLLASLRKVMQHRDVFGPQVLALAINIMANFVHNEPTSLTTMQEQKMPELFFDLVEADIEANFEVIASIPNAVSAICLNQAGLDLFNSRPVVQKLVSLLVSDRHVKVLQDRENATMFGTAIDELVRHQPSVKDKVITSILEAIRTILERGSVWDASKDEAPKPPQQQDGKRRRSTSSRPSRTPIVKHTRRVSLRITA